MKEWLEEALMMGSQTLLVLSWGWASPPAHSPLPFFLPKGSAALRWPVYRMQPVRGGRGPGSLLRPCHGADSPTASPPGLYFLFVGSDSL